MSPFLQTVVRTFPWCVLLGLLLWGLMAVFGDLRGLNVEDQLFVVLLGASELAVFVGGIRGLQKTFAGRSVGKDSPWRADRADVGLVAFLMGSAFGISFLGALRGGEIIAVVGGLMGFWLASSSPLSLVLMLVVFVWTLGIGQVALLVHQQSPFDVWKLELASLVVIVAAGLLRRMVVVSGPPGFVRTFVTLALLVLTPLAFGLFTPAHELSSDHGPKSLADQVMPFLLPFVTLLCCQWRGLANPTAEGVPAEPTQTGCGCSFLGLGLVMVALDSLGGSLLFLPLWGRVLLFLLVVAGCAVVALYTARQVRGKYRAVAAKLVL